MIHICIHILPFEIDSLEQLLIQLKRNSVYLPEDHGIKVEVCLNMQLVDWKSSSMKKDFFINKLYNLHNLTLSWSPDSTLLYNYEGTIQGCNDLRRKVIRITDKPYVMYLDADNVFNDYFLACIYAAVNQGSDEYRVIVPQTTRMWDSTWDCITNSIFLNEEASHEVYDNRDPYTSLLHYVPITSVSMQPITGFKFAGWGTTIDTRLARLIDIPDSLGSYGLDDTFIAIGCQILKDKGCQVTQYVLENQIIIENNKFRYNPYKDYLVNIDKRQEFLKQAQSNFQSELIKLHERTPTKN